jgi:hypothetical protein
MHRRPRPRPTPPSGRAKAPRRVEEDFHEKRGRSTRPVRCCQHRPPGRELLAQRPTGPSPGHGCGESPVGKRAEKKSRKSLDPLDDISVRL